MKFIFPTVKQLFQKYVKKPIEEWRTKTPKQKWQTIYDIGAILSESIGVTIYTTMENYWYSYVSEVLVYVFFLTASYTIWYYFGQGEYFRGLQATSAFGIIFSVKYLSSEYPEIDFQQELISVSVLQCLRKHLVQIDIKLIIY